MSNDGTPFIIGQSEVGDVDVIGGTLAATIPNFVKMADSAFTYPEIIGEALTSDA